MLVLIGADASGRKELLAIEDGWRESAQSWCELLLRLRDENGLALDPELATGDGAPGFFASVRLRTAKTRGCLSRQTALALPAPPTSPRENGLWPMAGVDGSLGIDVP